MDRILIFHLVLAGNSFIYIFLHSIDAAWSIDGLLVPRLITFYLCSSVIRESSVICLPPVYLSTDNPE